MILDYLSKTEKKKYFDIKISEKKEYYPLSSAQKRMYILNQMNPNNTSYNLPGMIFLKNGMNTEKLINVFRVLISRHESFRTFFEIINGEPVQRIHESIDFSIDNFKVKESESKHFLISDTSAETSAFIGIGTRGKFITTFFGTGNNNCRSNNNCFI